MESRFEKGCRILYEKLENRECPGCGGRLVETEREQFSHGDTVFYVSRCQMCTWSRENMTDRERWRERQQRVRSTAVVWCLHGH